MEKNNAVNETLNHESKDHHHNYLAFLTQKNIEKNIQQNIQQNIHVYSCSWIQSDLYQA